MIYGGKTMTTMLRVSTVATPCLLLFCSPIFSSDGSKGKIQYQGETHQYLVQQAWQLFKTQFPTIQHTEMNDHIGTWENSGPWTTGLAAAGAYREDLEDPVYGVGQPFNGWNQSSTHFWDADAGDDSKISVPLSRDIENAYQKARVYIYGADIWETGGYFSMGKPTTLNWAR